MLKQYLIERKIPAVGQSTREDYTEMTIKSNQVLEEMGSENIQWVESFVTDDKVVCFYRAKDPEIIQEHASRGGFPADNIIEVKVVMTPTTFDNRGVEQSKVG